MCLSQACMTVCGQRPSSQSRAQGHFRSVDLLRNTTQRLNAPCKLQSIKKLLCLGNNISLSQVLFFSVIICIVSLLSGDFWFSSPMIVTCVAWRSLARASKKIIYQLHMDMKWTQIQMTMHWNKRWHPIVILDCLPDLSKNTLGWHFWFIYMLAFTGI